MVVGGRKISKTNWMYESLISQVNELLQYHPGNLWSNIIMKQNYVAQSAAAVEYSDCFSAEG